MPRPTISTPMGLVLACATPFHSCMYAAGTDAFSPLHPPTFLSPNSTSGRNPAMMRKNCNTSL